MRASRSARSAPETAAVVPVRTSAASRPSTAKTSFPAPAAKPNVALPSMLTVTVTSGATRRLTASAAVPPAHVQLPEVSFVTAVDLNPPNTERPRYDVLARLASSSFKLSRRQPRLGGLEPADALLQAVPDGEEHGGGRDSHRWLPPDHAGGIDEPVEHLVDRRHEPGRRLVGPLVADHVGHLLVGRHRA